MANVKITALEHLSSTQVAPEDVFIIDDVNALITKKITLANVTRYISTALGNAKLVESNLASFAASANANAASLAASISNISAVFSIAGNSGSDNVIVGSETLVFSGVNGVSTAVYNNEVEVSLNNTAVVPGSYGGSAGASTNIPVITVDAKGRIVSAQNVAVVIDFASVESNVNSVAGNVAALTASTNSIRANVDSVSSNVSSLSTSVNTIRANVDSVQSNVIALDIRSSANINSVSSNVSSLATSVNTVRANVDSVSSNVASITNGTSQFTGNITMQRDLTIQGNLIVGGSTTTIDSNDTVLRDRVITLSNGAISGYFDSGLYISRGSDPNVFIGFDESSDQFVAAYTTDSGGNTVTDYNIASYANARFNNISVDGTVDGVDISGLSSSVDSIVSGATPFTGPVSMNATLAVSDAIGIGVSTPTAKLELAETWNNVSTTFTHIKSNITDTASASGSLLMDLRVGGTTRFNVAKAGEITINPVFSAGSIILGKRFGTSGFYTGIEIPNSSPRFTFFGSRSNGNYVPTFQFYNNLGFTVNQTTDADLIIARDDANILAQRNGINAQTSRIYNTYTDASNYERAKLGWNTNVLEIGTENAGTGVLRNINLIGGNVGIGTSSPSTKLDVNGAITFATNGSGTNYLRYERTGTNVWRLTSDGVGEIYRVSGNEVQFKQNVLVERAGLTVQPNTGTGPAITVNHTWNDVNTTFTGVRANITDSASAAGSMLMDLRVGGTTRFNVAKNGTVVSRGVIATYDTNTNTTSGIAMDTSYWGYAFAEADSTASNHATKAVFSWNQATGPGLLQLKSGGFYAWSSSATDPKIATDLYLSRDAANTLAQRRGTAAQTSRIYNTYTDASNYERAIIGWSSNVLQIGTEAAGTGTRRPINLNYSTTIDGGSQTNVPALTITNVGSGNGGIALGLLNIGYAQNQARITGFDVPNRALSYVVRGTAVSGQGAHRFSIDSTAGTAIGATGSVVDILAPATASNIFQCRQADGTVTLNVEYSGAITIANAVSQSVEATTLATTTKTQVASFPAASFRSGKLIVQAYDSVTGQVQISELLVAHNGTTASATEYGVVFTGTSAIVVYDVGINAGNVRLMATRTSANSTQYKISETLMIA